MEPPQPEKELIFTVTTGRSGTRLLSRLLGTLGGVESFHEPKPKFSDIKSGLTPSDDEAKRFWMKKLQDISERGGHIYIETSHLFCKGFFSPLLDLGVEPSLIIHRRAPRDVALSMYRLGTIPGRTRKGNKFYLHPGDDSTMNVEPWKGFSDYQLCYWYCLEVERRAQIYQERAPAGVSIAETTLEDVLNWDQFESLCSELELPSPGLLERIQYKILRRWKFNKKSDQKDNRKKPRSIVKKEREVWECIPENSRRLCQRTYKKPS